MPSSACKNKTRSEEHTSELQSHDNLVCRLLLEKKKSIAAELIRHVSRPGPRPYPLATRRACPSPRSRAADPPPSPGLCDVKVFSLFFLKNGAPPMFPPFPPPAVLPI